MYTVHLQGVSFEYCEIMEPNGDPDPMHAAMDRITGSIFERVRKHRLDTSAPDPDTPGGYDRWED